MEKIDIVSSNRLPKNFGNRQKKINTNEKKKAHALAG